LSNALEGQTAVVFGVANKRSIAWAIAQRLQEAGAKLAITYQNERLRQEAEEMIHALPNAEGFQCDVSSDAEIEQLFARLKERYGKLDSVIHSVAYAPAEDLKQAHFKDTSREGFRIAHDVSCYSLIAIARAAQPLMTDGGSIVTMTYYGSTRVVPYYNVMGVAKAALECTVRYLAYDLGPNNIRVNAISAGPIKTLAARGIGSFGEILKEVSEKAPLKRNIDANEVADTATFLCSPGARGITGETIFVDAGINVMAF
jgi:enoyl-[acyl-carrier protein] reductase I